MSKNQKMSGVDDFREKPRGFAKGGAGNDRRLFWGSGRRTAA
jgi:hypothetical protein